MQELELKYGCNPNQKPSRIYMEDGELPIKVLCGKPGYINFLDAFNDGKADAVLAASLFHFNEIPIMDLKHYLHENGIPVRL